MGKGNKKKNIACPICLGSNTHCEDTKLSVYLCDSCTHRFTNISKKEQEKYELDYFDDSHKNWFNNPNYWLFDYMIKRLPKKPIKLLDVGCGDGEFLKYARKKNKEIELWGIDFKENNHNGIKFIKGDIYKEKITEKFDVIVTLATLEHIDDPHKFIKIMKSLLKDNGTILIMTINSASTIDNIGRLLKSLGWRVAYNRMYNHHHLNHFTYHSLAKLVKSNNLKVLEHIKHNHPFKAIDVPKSSFIVEKIYMAGVIVIYLLSSVLRNQSLQTIVVQKEKQ